MDESGVRAWIAGYERAWRTAGTRRLDALFTPDATYQMAPFQEPHCGIDAIRVLWDAERAGPDEKFEMDYELIAVDDPRAVVRLDVRYGPPNRAHYRDLWVLEFAPDGRCRVFEEWPFSDGHPVPHHEPR
jgi:ketosteroid isomerase-like protein